MDKRRFLFLVPAILYLVIATTSLAFAETIIFKSGESVEGKIYKKRGRMVVVELPEGDFVVYSTDEIKEIQEEVPFPSKDIGPEPSPVLAEDAAFKPSAVPFEKYIEETKKYLLDEKYEDALLILKKVRELEPNNPEIYTGLGILYYYLEQFEEAIASFQKSLSFQQDNPDVYLFLGIIYDSAKQKQEAKNNLEKALELYEKEFDMRDFFLVKVFLEKIDKNNHEKK
ncbi:MAG: tetratricopeptide repeat protein [Candidatus Omnitrophota bacterium]